MPDTQAKAIGDFLRSRRRRLEPDAAERSRRRTPGLRREEIAQAAGIGVDWYTRLEQGRGGRPSPATVEGLARALRLDRAEAAHLGRLAAQPRRAVFMRESAPAELQRMIQGFAQPACLTGRRFDLLAANAAARALFGDFGGCGNTLVYVLTTPAGRALFGEGWEAQARRMTAQFRVVYDAFAGDPAFEELLARLDAGCRGFGDWWQAHDIRSAPSGCKRLHHPELGWTDYAYAAFQCNEDPAVKLTVYTPLRDEDS